MCIRGIIRIEKMLEEVDDWINLKTNFIWTIVVDCKSKKEEYLIFIHSSIGCNV